MARYMELCSARRRFARARMAWSNSSRRLPPRALARYMAASAFSISASGRIPGPWPRAMPTLMVTNTSDSPSANGVVTTLATRSAMVRAWVSSAIPSHRMVNSSPPKRATTSPGRTTSCRRLPSAISSRLPASWPSESLMNLKRSRSQNSTATAALERWLRASAMVAWSRKNSRLGRPVRASWVACQASRACTWERSMAMSARCAASSRSCQSAASGPLGTSWYRASTPRTRSASEAITGTAQTALTPCSRATRPSLRQCGWAARSVTITEPCLGALALGDVAAVEHHPAHRRIVEQVVGQRLHVPPAAVPSDHAELEGAARPSGPEVAEAPPDVLDVVGVDQVEDVVAEPPGVGVAEHAAQRRAGVGDAAARVEHDHHVRGVLHQRPEAGLGVAQRLLRPAQLELLGDVAGGDDQPPGAAAGAWHAGVGARHPARLAGRGQHPQHGRQACLEAGPALHPRLAPVGVEGTQAGEAARADHLGGAVAGDALEAGVPARDRAVRVDGGDAVGGVGEDLRQLGPLLDDRLEQVALLDRDRRLAGEGGEHRQLALLEAFQAGAVVGDQHTERAAAGAHRRGQAVAPAVGQEQRDHGGVGGAWRHPHRLVQLEQGGGQGRAARRLLEGTVGRLALARPVHHARAPRPAGTDHAAARAPGGPRPTGGYRSATRAPGRPRAPVALVDHDQVGGLGLEAGPGLVQELGDGRARVDRDAERVHGALHAL